MDDKEIEIIRGMLGAYNDEIDRRAIRKHETARLVFLMVVGAIGVGAILALL